MFRFYCKHWSDDVAFLSEDESQHCVKVLRKQEGDILLLTDGKGHTIEGAISRLHKKETQVNITKITFQEPRSKQLQIAIAPTKNISRIEWLVEKCTEMGIERIDFLLCKHSERKVVKVERLKKIALSAMKQSQRAYLPEIGEIIPIKKYLEEVEESAAKLICHYVQGQQQLKDYSFMGSNIIMIGPEGDFTSNEIEMARNAGFSSVNLGNARLRTETAGLYSCSAFNIINT